MAKQNSVNLDITNNADGFDIAGGTTSRKLTVSGADISLTGSGSATLTFPTTTGTVALVPGSDTQVAFNDGGSALGGDAGLTYNKTTDTLTVAGNLAVNGGDLTTSAATASVFDANATTVTAFRAATQLTFGATTGTTQIRNDATVQGDLTITGGDLITGAATSTLMNTAATNLSVGGAATTLTLGATSGTASIRNASLKLGNTTSSITTNTGSTNDITIAPYGTLYLSPNSTAFGLGGSRPSVSIQNSDNSVGLVSVAGGDLYLGIKTDSENNTYPVNIIFEGLTDNAFETTLTVEDPTADRTITFPDATGTVGVMSSPTNQQVQFYDSSTKNLKGDADLTFDGTNLQIGSQGDLRLADADSSNYVAFQAPSSVTNNNIYTLPSAVGTANQVLQIASVAGNDATLQWATVSGSGSPGGSDTYVQFNDGGSTFGGDAGLTYNKTTDTLTVTGDLNVNGGDINTTSAGASIFNNTATTVNIGGAATAVNIGTNANGAAVNLCNGNLVFSRTGVGMTYYSNLTDASVGGMNIKCNATGSPIQIGDSDGANNTTVLVVDDSSSAIRFFTGTGSYTFPGSNGTSGQVLFTNGSGTLAWGDVSAGVGLNVSTTSSSATVNIDDVFLFGDGADGDVTVTGSTTLTRDMFYNNLTINSSGSINTAGFRIYVKGTLDITAAAANSIQRNGTAGNSSASTTGAAAVTALSTGSVGSDTGSGAGGNGGAAAGTQGSAPTASTVSNGGQNGASGKGGNGTSGNGGAARSATTPTTCPINRIEHNLIRGVTLIHGGICGAGGSGGGGDGTAGGGGGSGGLGGGVVFVSAKTISRGASTAAGCISANGGAGGNGFQPAAGNRGGGGGGSGGGGGWIYLMYGSLSGVSATNAVRASGGTGGNGANGSGTGTAGDGGTGAGGGRIVVINMGTGALTSTVGTTGTANTGTTGGAGETLQVSI